MKYSDMTNREINKAVAEVLLKDYNLSDGHGDSVVCTRMDICSCFKVDYCNNWSDIGPIIEGNHISIDWCPDDEFYQARSQWISDDFGIDSSCFFNDKNPKRAAAICFLMINEALVEIKG